MWMNVLDGIGQVFFVPMILVFQTVFYRDLKTSLNKDSSATLV